MDNRVDTYRNIDLLESLHTVLSNIAIDVHTWFTYLYDVTDHLAKSVNYDDLVAILNDIIEKIEPWGKKISTYYT